MVVNTGLSVWSAATIVTVFKSLICTLTISCLCPPHLRRRPWSESDGETWSPSESLASRRLLCRGRPSQLKYFPGCKYFMMLLKYFLLNYICLTWNGRQVYLRGGWEGLSLDPGGYLEVGGGEALSQGGN